MHSKNDEMCQKLEKWPYLGHLASNKKTKVTLFSSTLKVEENKVPLVFHLEAHRPRYGHFVIFSIFPLSVVLPYNHPTMLSRTLSTQ